MAAIENLKILLVDDHIVVRKGMKLLIQSKMKNTSIFDVKNGLEAIKICAETNFDIVITDITMPEMTGIELTKIITEKHPEIKVIIISMHTDEVYIKDAFDMGAKGYLSKDMEDENEIIDAIGSVLAGNTYYGKIISQELIKSMFSGKKATLTNKEISVIKHLSDGLAYRDIADKMKVSPRTVETYRKNILDKLKLKTTADIIKYAIKNGFVSLS